MLLRKQINPACPRCGGKTCEGPRFTEGGGVEIPRWYCVKCDLREDIETSSLKATHLDYCTQESTVYRYRWGLQWMLNNLKGIEHEWAKDACAIARQSLNS